MASAACRPTAMPCHLARPSCMDARLLARRSSRAVVWPGKQVHQYVVRALRDRGGNGGVAWSPHRGRIRLVPADNGDDRVVDRELDNRDQYAARGRRVRAGHDDGVRGNLVPQPDVVAVSNRSGMSRRRRGNAGVTHEAEQRHATQQSSKSHALSPLTSSREAAARAALCVKTVTRISENETGKAARHATARYNDRPFDRRGLA